jgi:hypothetical protein
MNMNYQISTGQLTDDDGTLIATGFAGNNSRPGVNPDHIQGLNNPAMVSVRCIGPLPPGLYRVGSWGDHPPVGPDSASLTQIGGETYGRDGFFLHGPGADPENSSEGCIVIGHLERIKVMGMNPTTITVSA